MRIGVVVFPGSNCDRDALHAARLAGAEATALWHETPDLRRLRRGDPARRLRLRRLPARGRPRALQPDHGRGPRARGRAAGWCSASATASRSWPRPGCCRARCCATRRCVSSIAGCGWRGAARHPVHVGACRRAGRCACRSRTARAATSCRRPTWTRSRHAAAWSSATRPGGQPQRLGARHRGRAQRARQRVRPDAASGAGRGAAAGLGRRPAAVPLARRECRAVACRGAPRAAAWSERRPDG